MDDVERMHRLAAALQEWVERERAELERKGIQPSQRYLRRLRISEYVSEPDFLEAVRELETVGRQTGT